MNRIESKKMKQRSQRQGSPEAREHPLDDTKAYEEHSLEELRSAGYRITMPRVQVIRALADTKCALSAYAIHEKIVGSGGKIDVVSVYRILSTLQDVGLIHHIGIVDGYFPCRIGDCAGKRSEVVVFEDSGEVMELILPAVFLKALEEQAEQYGFNPNAVKVEISGSAHKGAGKKHPANP